MPRFTNPPKLYNEGSHDKSIDAARQDLEADFPQANVFIWSNDINPGAEVVSIIPTEPGAKVLRGRFEIHAKTAFVRTFGYRWMVFTEGTIRYDHGDKSG